MQNDFNVAVYRQIRASYPDIPPFHPSQDFPEYPFKGLLCPNNTVYDSIRKVLLNLGLDKQNFGSQNWNPLRSIIKKGDTVLVKPNMIAHSHRYSDDWEYVITHGSVIRAVIDYVYLALRGEGRIIIADAPQTDSNIDLIKKRMGIDEISDLYWTDKQFEIEFIDLRNEWWVNEQNIYMNTVKLPGDPKGNVLFDLGESSFLSELDGEGKRYYGAFYDIDETNRHHRNGIHEYLISKTAIDCDAFISLPKLKTHKKVGVTLNLKGLVGINGNKNYLPHYSLGTPEDSGDQFPEKGMSRKLENAIVLKAKNFLLSKNLLAQKLAIKFKEFGYRLFGDTESVVRSGNWHGNDTCWRMALDLNQILLYGNSNGSMGDRPKKYFSIIDGIIGMEGNGPVAGVPKAAGLVIAGKNPLAVDMVSTYIIGFDYNKIPMLFRAFDTNSYPFANFKPEEIEVESNIKDIVGKLFKNEPNLNFKFEPHFGWDGHIQRL